MTSIIHLEYIVEPASRFAATPSPPPRFARSRPTPSPLLDLDQFNPLRPRLEGLEQGEGDTFEGQGAGALDGEGDGAAFAADEALDDDGGGDQEDGRAAVDGVAADGLLTKVPMSRFSWMRRYRYDRYLGLARPIMPKDSIRGRSPVFHV